MILCVNLFWPSKIICSLILMQNMFNVWVFGDKRVEKLVFGRSGLNSCVFETFKLMHFIHDICWIELFLHKICSSFQKFQNSKFSLDRLKLRLKFWFEFACLDRCLIDARSIESLFRSIEAQFQLIKFWKLSVLKKAFSRVLHYFQIFSNTFLTFSLLPIQTKKKLSFSSINLSKVFVLKH